MGRAREQVLIDPPEAPATSGATLPDPLRVLARLLARQAAFELVTPALDEQQEEE